MQRAITVAVLAYLAACGSAPGRPWLAPDAGARETDASRDAGSAATYAADSGCPTASPSQYGPAFIRDRCTSCHSAAAVGAARSGAPDGLNFDDEADIRTHAYDIRTQVVVQRRMPPSAAVADCEAALLGAYLDAFGACAPRCSGRSCGDDGCGGSCGACSAPEVCEAATGLCVSTPCEPNCIGAGCGADGCGGSCGTCGAGLSCLSDRSCGCTPSCDQRSCGPDGCGGTCGTCGAQEVCSLDGSCLCLPSCDGKVCGSDGCGGSCGTCPSGSACNAGASGCQCIPNCQNRSCGPDGCGGNCGSCAQALTCNTRTGACVHNCQPNCTGRVCGDDGCGGSCGTACGAGQVCTTTGQCACAPSCLGKACGSDGCGGTCGSCSAGTSCNASGQCGCTPNCSGRSCGDDGCGGSCGTCNASGTCASGQCVTQCVPSCSGHNCGDDGCGGSCGACASGQTCAQGTCSYPSKSFGADVYPIMKNTSCAKTACHSGAQPAEGLDLSTNTLAYSHLVNVTAAQCARLLVQPGQPSNSYLVNKLTGVDMCSGSRMPKGGASWSSTQMDTLRSWIGSGAAP